MPLTLSLRSRNLLDRSDTALLESPISVTQDGKTQASDDVWTGTSSDGEATNLDCSNWTVGMIGSGNSFLATIGETAEVNGEWTERERVISSCANKKALYCFPIRHYHVQVSTYEENCMSFPVDRSLSAVVWKATSHCVGKKIFVFNTDVAPRQGLINPVLVEANQDEDRRTLL